MSPLVDFPNIRNITISGRIGSGQTTLATKLAQILRWKLLEGGVLFEKIHRELKINEIQVDQRPDSFDLEYEEKIKRMLKEESHNIIQSHLASFDAQGISSVFKILLVCQDERGNDKTEIRIDRVINSRGMSVEGAKEEVIVREARNLEKWRRLYAGGDKNWVYFDKKYYDLVINTYSHNQEETLKIALRAIGYKP